MWICEELVSLGPRNETAILDSGATGSATGKGWIEKLPPPSTRRPRVNRSDGTFKFGDSRAFSSIGAITTPHCFHAIDGKNYPRIIRCNIHADIVDSRIPLLASRNALKKMSGVLDFESSQLMINRRYRAQPQVLSNGHLGLPLADSSGETGENPDVAMCVDETSKQKSRIYTIGRETERGGESVSGITMGKMHLHMAHLSLGDMRKILKAPGRPFLESDLANVVQNCDCVRQDTSVQRPLISRYVPEYCGRRCVLTCFIHAPSRHNRNPIC